MTKSITIEYSENFRLSEKADKVYSKLQEMGLDPLRAIIDHDFSIGRATAVYTFRNSLQIPSKSELEKMLKGFYLNDIQVIDRDQETGEVADTPFKPARPYAIDTD